MKRTSIIIATAILGLFVSCQKEDLASTGTENIQQQETFVDYAAVTPEEIAALNDNPTWDLDWKDFPLTKLAYAIEAWISDFVISSYEGASDDTKAAIQMLQDLYRIMFGNVFEPTGSTTDVQTYVRHFNDWLVNNECTTRYSWDVSIPWDINGENQYMFATFLSREGFDGELTISALKNVSRSRGINPYDDYSTEFTFAYNNYSDTSVEMTIAFTEKNGLFGKENGIKVVLYDYNHGGLVALISNTLGKKLNTAGLGMIYPKTLDIKIAGNLDLSILYSKEEDKAYIYYMNGRDFTDGGIDLAIYTDRLKEFKFLVANILRARIFGTTKKESEFLSEKWNGMVSNYNSTRAYFTLPNNGIGYVVSEPGEWATIHSASNPEYKLTIRWMPDFKVCYKAKDDCEEPYFEYDGYRYKFFYGTISNAYNNSEYMNNVWSE